MTVWIQSIYQHSNPNISKVLVGNKLDLEADFRAVNKHTAEALAKENDMDYFETSAYKNENIQEMLNHIMEKVYDLKIKKKESLPASETINLAKPRQSEMNNQRPDE